MIRCMIRTKIQQQPFTSFQYPKKQQKRKPFDGLPLLLFRIGKEDGKVDGSEVRVAHEVAVYLGGTVAALPQTPDHKALAPAHVAAGKDLLHVGAAVWTPTTSAPTWTKCSPAAICAGARALSSGACARAATAPPR